MDINTISNYIIGLVPVGCAMRLAILAVSMTNAEDGEEKEIKKKMSNTFKWLIIGSCAGFIKNMAMHYFS